MPKADTKTIGVAVGFLLIAVGLLVWQVVDMVDESPSGDPLAGRTYEESAPVSDREAAAVAISRESRQVAVPKLREIARDDPDPAVRAAAIAGLGEHYDYRSMEMILDRMDSDSQAEKIRARAAVARMMGPRIKVETGSDAEKKRIAAEAYRRIWANMKRTERLKKFREKLDRKYGELP